ncbi:MAG: CBS domain-containing protein [Methanobacteriota archaeon]|nr:MAG: CBS domain-containing protein [Euryarchaeota archaeon]
MKIRDLQIDDEYFTVNHNETVLELARKITETGIPDAVVLKENKPVGVVDDFDIVSKCVAENKDPANTSVEEIMHAPPFVTPDHDLKRLEQIFEEMDPSIVPVVDDHQNLLGVATLFDLLSVQQPKKKKLFNFGGK